MITFYKDVATEFPGGDFHGIDVYDIFPRNIRPANVHFQSCDALEGLPFPDNTFDLVNMRMLYVALKKDEWSLMFKEIYRVLKPGGFLQSCECTTIVRLKQRPCYFLALKNNFIVLGNGK